MPMLLDVPRVPLSDDVFRGLRWGAILLAGLAVCVAGYRLVRESPPKPAHETSALTPVAPVEKSASLPAAKSIDKPAGKPVLLTSGSRPVPPPPSRVAKPVVANPPRAGSGDGVLTGEPASKNQDESAVIVEKPTGPSAEPVDEKDADQSAAEKSDSAESSNAAKQEGRPKRWIKAVGKLLGLGRKDSQPH
jgi:hypothetical protein